jgi:predicted metal-dependent hydrolase
VSESAELSVAGERIALRIRTSARRRTLALEVASGGDVVVAAPAGCPHSIIRAFARQHADWILRKRRELAAARARPQPVLADGARLPWLGEWLTLRLQDAARSCRVERIENNLHVPALAPERLRGVIEQWYRRSARVVALRRLAHYAPQVGRRPAGLHIRGQRTRWGSCSARGVVSLNWRLIQAPITFLDYVVVHELCHLLEPNHSVRFWAAVERLLPDYRARRAGLARAPELFVV